MVHVAMELMIDEGRVAGARYLTAQPKFDWEELASGPYWRVMEAWCADTLGPTPPEGVWTAGARWYVNNRKFWFRNQEDLTLFLLRWS